MRLIVAPLLMLVRLVIQTVFLALGQIWANKTRSLLTCLGIIFGVAAVIGTVAGLNGMRDYVLKEFETFGARKIYMWGYVPEPKRSTMSWDDAKLTSFEAGLILTPGRAPSVEALTPVCDMSWDIGYGAKVQRGVEVSGIWPSWHEIEDRKIVYGRPFSAIDNDERRMVCLVNQAAVDDLRMTKDPTGEFLLIAGRRFLVIGMVETKQLNFIGGGGAGRAEVFIPFDTHKSINPYSWTNFLIQTTDPKANKNAANDAMAEIRFTLRKHRQLKPEDEDTFRMEALQSVIDQFNQLATGITMVAGFVVGIALLVGGIGIMNIMLVSVSERTREIGLRKAVGAQPIVVLLQFLVEAVVLCVAGGAVGLAIGQGVALGLRSSADWMADAKVPPWAVILAFGFSAAVGVIFGMFPAIKAARLNPIDALRHE